MPRKDIDYTKLGINAFANDPRSVSAAAQLREVRDTLRLTHLRLLFSWTTAVQPSPSAAVNFSLFDDLVAAIPAGVEALVIVTGLPAWMSNSSNWINGNPRTTFIEKWLRPVLARYGRNPRIIAWQIGYEPNTVGNPENITLAVAASADNYVEMLALGSNLVRELSPGKLVLNAATSAINQNYSETLDYNRAMRDAGALSLIDRWAVHYYGKQYENVVRGGGVEDFLNGLGIPVWVTESGAQGVNEQLAYGEEVWPFLIDHISALERIYIYQFTEATPNNVTYGLRNLDPAFPISDLYVHLRDR